MIRYVALFDGMNLGAYRLTMAELRPILAREELEDVETVVASDNVLFSFEERPSPGLEDLFAHVLRDRFDVKTFVAVRNADELRSIIDASPFQGLGTDEMVVTHFLASQPTQSQLDSLRADMRQAKADAFVLRDHAMFVDFREIAGSAKSVARCITKHFGAGVARDQRSLRRILDKMVAVPSAS